jgi:hypothetical protein
MIGRTPTRAAMARTWSLSLAAGLIATAAAVTAAGAQATNAKADPRVGLKAGWKDAGEAASGMALIGHGQKPEGFYNPDNLGDFAYLDSDLAFSGHYVFQGNFHGLQIWDVSDPTHPSLRTTMVCPGGQGDPSIYGNLMFMSVEETRGRVDCGTQGVKDTVSAERFRGVRIFDVSDIDHPKKIVDVQTCRGSHTHTLVPDPKDAGILWVYVSGTSTVRPGAELAGCSGAEPEKDPNTSLFRIEVIRVPLASPQDAKVVSSPRIFADAKTGAVDGLAKEMNPKDTVHSTARTDQCHDITAYPAIGLAAGACSGNGILLDIRNPSQPKRIAEVSDPNFAYWHSATFSNDGKKVLFTDEWGGGVAPRCRATDPIKWGADAIYTIGSDDKMQLGGFFKMPAPQTETENCVAHNGSLIPIPGRDVMAQGWYQGGVSVFDFTDAAHPKEIAFFDRGPMDSAKLYIAGFWNAYWFNGHIYGSEIGRGLDIFDLKASENLSQNEIDAAKLVHFDVSNPSDQPKLVWPPAFVVARAYLDQLVRMHGVDEAQSASIAHDLDAAEQLSGKPQKAALTKLASRLDHDAAKSADPVRVRAMAATVKALANA